MERIVIAIGRQFGSGGREIAKRVAEELGIEYVDKELLTLAAEESGISEEAIRRADERPVNPLSYASVQYPIQAQAGFYDLSASGAMLDDKIFQVQADIIRKLSETRSCVIVGRCADYIVQDKSHCFSVFLHATMPWRVRRIARLYELEQEEAKKQIVKFDKKRAAYYNFYTGQRWGDASHYDLAINVSSIGIGGAAKVIVAYARDFHGVEG